MIFLINAALFLPLLASQTAGGDFSVLREFQGPHPEAYFGREMANAGDVNADGIDDLLVGADSADNGALFDAGWAGVYSGADGTLLHSWFGAEAQNGFGGAVAAAGDLNQDGFADILIGSSDASPPGFGRAGSAFAFSGLDGSILFQWDGTSYISNLGASVASAGDVDGDGIPDVLVGDDAYDPVGLLNAGAVFLYSGADGSLIHRFDGVADHDKFGFSVLSPGDLNGDGVPEIVVGAPDSDFIPGGSDNGAVTVFSGADYSIIRSIPAGLSGARHGYGLADAGDVNADGVNDIMVSAVFADGPGWDFSAGRVTVWSGLDGALLHDWYGEKASDNLGLSMGSIGDLNGDGYDDMLVGADANNVKLGYVWVRSGADGTLLHRFGAEEQGAHFGGSCTDAGDIDGDGKAEIAIGAWNATVGGVSRMGTVTYFDYEPFLTSDVHRVSAAGGATLNLDLDFPAAAAGLDYITAMSITGTGPLFYGVEIPLTLDVRLLDSAAGIYPLSQYAGLHGTLDAAGEASASITILPGELLGAVGRSFYLAAVVFPSGSLPTYSSIATVVTMDP